MSIDKEKKVDMGRLIDSLETHLRVQENVAKFTTASPVLKAVNYIRMKIEELEEDSDRRP